MTIRQHGSRGMLAGILVLALLLSAAPLSVAAPGDPDPSFDGDGKVTTDFGGLEEAHAVVVDAQGRIVVAGGGSGFAVARYLSDGSLDSTFGVGGKVITASGSNNLAFAAALDSRGRIVVAGRAWKGSGYDFTLARYLDDGTLDPSFGSDGKVFTDFGGVSDFALAIVLDRAGRIVTAGRASPQGDYDFAVARYLEDGTLDASFGAGGKVITDFGESREEDTAFAAAMDSTGRIVIAGYAYASAGHQHFALARYLEDGTPDPSFGSGGKIFGLPGSGAAAELDAMGRIIVAGTKSGDFAAARYLTDGALDSSFGTGGSVTTDFGGFDQGNAMVLDAAGRIVIAGDTGTGGDFGLARYLPDGTPDPGFGSDGTVTTDFGGDDSAYAAALDPMGRLVVAGDTWTFPEWDFAVARYQGDPLKKTYQPLILR